MGELRDAPCPNCGDPTPANYCPNCGQRKVERHVSLGRLILEVLDDQFSLNSALPRTLSALLIRPGRLTVEYMSGRIARYVQPFRLYLVLSIVFFLLLTIVGNLGLSNDDLNLDLTIDGESVGSEVADSALIESGVEPDSLRAQIAEAREIERRVSGEPAAWTEEVEIETGSSLLDARIRQKIDELGRMPPELAIRTVVNDFLESAPVIVFLLLPLFAGLLKLLYLRSGRYYVEHFIFALHIHSFAFVAFTLMLLVRQPIVIGLLGLYLMGYTFVAMRTVYRQGVLVTTVKWGLLGMLYFYAFMLALAAGIVATLALG